MTARDGPIDGRAEILDRRQALENRVWRVWLNRLAGANGAVVDDYLTLGPKRDRADQLSGVAVLPVRTDGAIVLVQVHRPTLDVTSWEVPRGFLDPDREPEAMARIELAEEAGLSCPDDGLTHLGTVMSEPSTIAGRTAVYLAERCVDTGDARDVGEPGLGLALAFGPGEVHAMITDGRICDATTLAAFALRQVDIATP